MAPAMKRSYAKVASSVKKTRQKVSLSHLLCYEPGSSSTSDASPTASAVPAVPDVKSALKAALRSAHFAGGLSKGFSEAEKAFRRRKAKFCVLAENCQDPTNTRLMKVLCKMHSVPLMKVADKTLLGEWCGLCQYYPEDTDSKVLHVVGWVIDCPCAVVRDYGTDELAKIVLQHHFDTKKK